MRTFVEGALLAASVSLNLAACSTSGNEGATAGSPEEAEVSDEVDASAHEMNAGGGNGSTQSSNAPLGAPSTPASGPGPSEPDPSPAPEATEPPGGDPASTPDPEDPGPEPVPPPDPTAPQPGVEPTAPEPTAPEPTPSGDSTTLQVNCMPCAQNQCPEQYDACSDEPACGDLLLCGDACWADDDWTSFDECTLQCALAVAGDAQVVQVATALTDCAAIQCDESECLTRSVEDDEPAPAPEQAPVNVEYSEGYFTADVFNGYVWLEADEESSFELAPHEAGGPLCVRGVIMPGPTLPEPGTPYPRYARFGLNLNQSAGEPAPTPETVDRSASNGLSINDHPLIYAGTLPTTIELWEPGAASDATRRWCAISLTSRLGFRSFTRCSEGFAGDSLDETTPIEALVFYFEGGAATKQVSYCLYQLLAF